MGTVFNRGTKDKPNWYVGFRDNGRWVYKPSRQPTKALGKAMGPGDRVADRPRPRRDRGPRGCAVVQAGLRGVPRRADQPQRAR